MQKNEIRKQIVNNSKQRVEWACKYIQEQPNFRDEVLGKMKKLCDFFENQILKNVHPQFWKRSHKIFELQLQEVQGRQLQLARKVLRSIDDYRDYYLQVMSSQKKKVDEEKQEHKQSLGQKIFRQQKEAKEEKNIQQNNNEENIEDNNIEEQSQNQSPKRFYGNYYKEYVDRQKDNKKTNKPTLNVVYTKSAKKRKSKKSPWIRTY